MMMFWVPEKLVKFQQSAQHPNACCPFSAVAGVDTFDGRSDDKGAEPEGLAMAEIDGRY